MTRILVHVEGQTEEEFVNQCLGPHLLPLGKFVEAKFIGNARQRGGICSWHDAKRDIRNHLLQDSRIFATLMVDFYALPQEGHKAWPGRKESNALTFQNKGDFVENALCTEIVNLFDSNFDVQRFVPFVMMHEFEGLLFSDCPSLAKIIGQSDLVTEFQKIRDAHSSPEEINDSYETCPSRRIERHFPQYQKPLHGIEAIKKIGIKAIRAECKQFDQWITRLEDLSS